MFNKFFFSPQLFQVHLLTHQTVCSYCSLEQHGKGRSLLLLSYYIFILSTRACFETHHHGTDSLLISVMIILDGVYAAIFLLLVEEGFR
jgi:hypothetical protein